ncbi:MFS transporter [Mycobacterium manitobense]|uniref:MFS transporter n=1 Tax=[Mycobacterium] manitobense TaxID=190147 RepID=A0A9X2YT73_9MYCO|nr:Cmx/CmrA family chloramphenicol efflux MFS transporter [[Mycobacterium] manitobense]MCV7173698.1 MFS transporter [[Mycobacterium] manitobense]
MPLALYLLAVAVFAMGTSEFMLAGLLPDIAAALDVSLATAGLLTSAFAAGMAVGAPLMAALSRQWPARTCLLGFVLLFAGAHAVGALTTSFAVLLVTRIAAALANAAFLAVALTVAATLVPADRKGRAVAVLLSGTTVAMIAGVPAGAALGELLGWRAPFWAIALLCLPAAVGVTKVVPNPAGDFPRQGPRHLSLRSEFAQLTNPVLVLTMLVGALFNGASFATITYVAPIVTSTAGMGELWVPIVLLLFGFGSFIGVAVAWRLSDRHPGAVIGVGGPLLLLGWVAMATLATEPATLVLSVFVQGALSFGVGSTLIARVLYQAVGAPTMGGSYATAALNIGAAGGPAIAAASFGTHVGHLGPVWASSLLTALAVVVALPLLRVIVPPWPRRRLF